MSQGETIGADEALPVVPCPAPEHLEGEVPAEDNYMEVAHIDA
jgi:hypothetical protein